MFYPIFSLFLIFVAWFTYERKKHAKDYDKKKEAFWAREAESNSIRRKNLDTLDYITIPLDSLPLNVSDNEEIVKCVNTLRELSTKRIFNLTGMTTTDIKFEYGPANVAALDEYDNNFTEMVTTIYRLGTLLYENNYVHEAITILEFNIDSLADILGNYKLLAKLYIEVGTPHKIDHLIETANKLNSLSKGAILKHLKGINR